MAAILIPQFTGFQAKARSSQALVEAKQAATALDGLIAEDAATIDAAAVAKIAGVPAANITAVNGTTGALTYSLTLTVGGNAVTYTVTRNGRDHATAPGEFSVAY